MCAPSPSPHYVEDAFGRHRGSVQTALLLAFIAATSLLVSLAAAQALTPAALALSLAMLLLAACALAFAKHEIARADALHGRLSAYLNTLDEHFLMTTSDCEGRFLWANANFLQRTGYSLAELAKQPTGGICAGVYGSDYLAEMWSTVRSGKSWSGEFCDITKDDGLLWIKSLVVPMRNGQGQIESLTTISVDVSEQRTAETELKNANARLQSFIKHAPAAVAMFDKDMRYIAHTDRWLRDYRLGEESLVGRHHYDVFPEIPLHWRAKHQRILKGATESSEEERFTRADGTEHILRWEVRPWYMPDNSIGGMIMLTEDITERKRLQDNLWRLARLDPLTGLPNRRHFGQLVQDALAEAAENGSEVGIALVDIDKFKEINDTLGHDAGDELLKTLSQRFADVLADFGVVSRLGGDEFALSIKAYPASNDLDAAIQAIQKAIAEPVMLDGVARFCSASIGVTVFPRDARQQSDLLKNADLALYRAKSAGRDRAMYFTPDLRTSLDRRMELQNAVLHGIAQDDFVLFYQPVMPASSAEPIACEALLRWKHPVLGLLTPGQFEEALEDPKVAFALGDKVLDMCIAQIAQWQHLPLRHGRVAINVTSADFHFGSLASRLEEKLSAHNVPPDRICIEVTERVFLGSDVSNVTTSLNQLKALGVEIALDDFGTGYASLTHIKAFPIDRLKIDRMFVRDMQEDKNSLSIVQAITQLARSLGLQVTAEGVETEEQLTLLKALGCSSIQGYYYARPMPADQFARFLSSACERVLAAAG